MNRFRPSLLRGHRRTAVAIDVTVHGVLNVADGRIADLSEGGARIEGASMAARSRCEIHYRGQIVYGVVMWSEIDRIGVRFPYELVDGPLLEALERARGTWPGEPAQIFHTKRPAAFGRRGLN